MSELSASAEDYLKQIWSATERSATPVTVGALALQLNVSASTVSEAVAKLARRGLISHPRYGSIELTTEGRGHAIAMVRRHRLLETFLVRELGYGWDEVHDEAEILEHAVSDRLIARIDDRLGHPARDPHGDPIPPRGDQLPAHGDEIPLSTAEPGTRVTIIRVSDSDRALLRYCARLGLQPGTRLTVMEPRPFAAGTTIRTDRREKAVEIGETAADAIWVSAA